jgi:hypothetical protein
VIRRTLAATVVSVSVVAAIAAAAGPSADQETSAVPAAARNYWAFRLPVQAPLPDVSARFQNPIDRFLEDTRQSKGLQAAPRAPRAVLLRRAYLDLIGLPPSPAETAAFLADNAPDAWDRLIDTLLASPHYGSAGASLAGSARYADSSGFEAGLRPSERLALSRLRDSRLQPGQALRRLPQGTVRRRRARHEKRRHADCDRVPARRPARRLPREGQPGAPLRIH